MLKNSMQDAVFSFPEFLEQAQKIGGNFKAPKIEARKIAILGMGGSAIGGELLRVAVEKQCPVPLAVIRDEEIPAWIDENTLVLAVSYSGNTRETLRALSAARAKANGKIIAVSTGGKLKKEADLGKIPHLEIPGGLMPRAALAFTFVPLLHILAQCAGLPDPSIKIHEAIEEMKELRENIGFTAGKNHARVLGEKLWKKIPVIFSSTPSLYPAALRWKCQINENAKQPAYCGTFPEAAHNEIVGFTSPMPQHPGLFAVFLRDSDETPAVKKSIAFCEEAVRKTGTEVHEIFAQGKNFIARLLYLCYYGDFVSLYLAEKNGVDPLPITIIDQLKKRSESP